jgi:hypothetical protein
MYNDTQTAIGCMLYIVYIVGINWSYLKEYKSKGTVKDSLRVQKSKEGNEWE